VSTGGSDSSSCTSTAPCRTFDRAYRVAKAGQVVQVAGGTYAPQWIKADGTKTGGAPVVFRPAAGARVVISGDLDVEAAHVEFRDLDVGDNWYARAGAHHLTFRNVDTSRFYIASATDVQVLGGDIGPSVDAVSQIKTATGSTLAPRNIVLDGLNVHDFTRTSTAQHMECLHVMAADGVAIRNSRFDDCSIFGISFNEHGDSNAMRGIVVENNWFGDILDGGSYAVHFSEGAPCEAQIRFNTFASKGVSQGCPETGTGVSVSSNIMSSSPSTGAINGYRWDYNVYQSGRALGAHDLVAAVPFVDPATFDLHIKSGSPAIGRGESAVAPAIDIDRQQRSAAPDVGADQL
jgi:hypothetical protein